jgi:hypothetical protein
MTEPRPKEEIEAKSQRTFATVYDDRVGMSARQLLARGEEAFEALLEELEVLHRQLPRKSTKRLERTRDNRMIVGECLRGARARVAIAAAAAEGLGDPL